MRRLHGAFVALAVIALAACGGGVGQGFSPKPVPVSSGMGTGTVSFLVVVPSTTTAIRKRPNVVVPSSATSITFTIDTVNGTAYTGTPTTETLSASNTSCTSVSGQLTCAFNLTAPVGAVVYTVTVYDGTSVIAEGNVAVTTTAGAAVNAPLTLTGTVAKIAITGPAVPIAGQPATYALTVQAEDANGYTILGTYTSAITLTDSDTTGDTSIATSGSDNPPAGELISSSDTASLNYNGGTLSTPATIGASATGVSAANVTTASFAPIGNYYASNGSVSFGQTSYELSGYDAAPAPTASPAWATMTTSPIPIATGQSFDGVNNAIGVGGISSTDSLGSCCQELSSLSSTYYAWSITSAQAALGLLGFADPANEFYEYMLYAPASVSVSATLVQTCAAPYPQLLVLPMPATWNVYTGSGGCTTAYVSMYGDSDTDKTAADGSYTDNYSEPSGAVFPQGSAALTVGSSGAVSYTLTGSYGAGSMTIPAPSPDASTIPVSFATPAVGVAFFPTPAPSTAPNPWAAIGLPNGVPPSPLLQDTMTYKGAISSLPAMCAVPSGLVPASNPPLTEVDETIVSADPMEDWQPFYTSSLVKHYYLNGVGEVCNENQSSYDLFDGLEASLGYGWAEFWSYNQLPGGALAWYTGLDDNYDSSFSDTYTYITDTSLKAVSAKVRDFTKVAPTAAMELTETTYALAHGGLGHRLLLHRTAREFAKRWIR